MEELEAMEREAEARWAAARDPVSEADLAWLQKTDMGGRPAPMSKRKEARLLARWRAQERRRKAAE